MTENSRTSSSLDAMFDQSFSIHATVKQMQGRRTVQEDRHVMIENLHSFIECLPSESKNGREVIIPSELRPACLFALFDGHMGPLASTFCSKQLPIEIIKELSQVPTLFLTKHDVNEANSQKSFPTTNISNDQSENENANQPKRRKLNDSVSGVDATLTTSESSNGIEEPSLVGSLSERTSSQIECDQATAVTTEESVIFKNAESKEIQFPKHFNGDTLVHSISADIKIDVDGISQALKRAFISTDSQFLKKHRLNKDGSTAVVALILGTSLFTAWVGDSRAILGSSRSIIFSQSQNSSQLFQIGEAVPGVVNPNKWISTELTEDHKPSRPDEQQRIKTAGGVIVNIGGITRVARADFEEECKKLKQATTSMGASGKRPPVALAVSRSMGDREFKQSPAAPLISCEPEIRYLHLVPSGDRVVIIGCDGIFDVLTSQDVVDLIHAHDNVNAQGDGTAKGASELVKLAFQRGSEDNLTAIVLRLESSH